MRFLLACNGKDETLMIVPAQSWYPMADFHMSAEHLSNARDADYDAQGNELRTYRFHHELHTEDGVAVFFAKVRQRRIIGKHELWHKYLGPKALEVCLKFPASKDEEARKYLDELMKDLSINEYPPYVEREITNFYTVDSFYRERYKFAATVEQQINEALKDSSLPSE